MDRSKRKRKIPEPLVLNGINYSFEDKSNDFICPICFEIIEEAHVTKCGHTFCFKCISMSLERSNRCPKCAAAVDQVFPNFLLNELIGKNHRDNVHKKSENSKNALQEVIEIQSLLNQRSDQLKIGDIDSLLEFLSKKKKECEETSMAVRNQLLSEFLTQCRKHKEEQLDHVNRELNLIDNDNKRIEDILKLEAKVSKMPESSPENVNGVGSSNIIEKESSPTSEPSSSGYNAEDSEIFNKNTPTVNTNQPSTTLKNRRKKMQMHFKDLEQSYFTNRAKNLILSSSGDDTSTDGLTEFSETLNRFTNFSSLRSLSTLCYTSDPFGGSSIVSSIEFDKDNEFFAIAGVTKKIKLFEYSTVVRDTLDIHYPITEMECNSKISCISWSTYYKSMMASSDYEGTVTIWDAFTNKKVKIFQEHEKRCWSVDFNKVDTKLVASGSDDAKVKLWSVNMEHSITSLEAKANVCCVKFNPNSRYHVAFGSADHCVHYYDLRN